MNGYNIGTNISYMIFIMQSWQIVLPNAVGELGKGMFNISVGLVCFLVAVPFSMKEQISKIKVFTQAGLYSCILLLFMVMINSFVILLRGEALYSQQSDNADSTRSRLQAIPLNFGIVLFLYDISSIVTTVRKQMQFPQQEMKRALVYYFVINFLLSVLIGLPAYLAYGDQTKEMIFMNMKSLGLFAGTKTDLIAGFYCLTLLVNMVLYSLPVFE